MSADVWAGFLIGFFGSFHCAGMCGPIVLALPVGNISTFQLVLSRTLYNFGRILTYTFFGAVFGFFGREFAFAGLQRYISISIGIMILFYYLTPAKYKGRFAATVPYKLLSNFVKGAFKKITKDGSPLSLFLFGIINGFLPCGFVYVAIGGAITTGGAISGAAFMALFGLGTTPIMLGTALLGRFINVKIRHTMNKLIPVFAVILAILFILRGLNLGIDYISPELSNDVLEQSKTCAPDLNLNP